MNKTLLISITLLIISGGIDAYGQAKPTVTLDCDTSICVSGDALIKLSFTGLAPFTFTYSDGTQTSEQTVNAYSREYSLTTNQSRVISISSIYDQNFPKSGGISGEIIGEGKITIDEQPSVSASDDIKTCRMSLTLDGDHGSTYTVAYWKPTLGGSFDDPLKKNATFTADASGDFTFWYKVENGSCADSVRKDFPIAFQNPPSATFSIADERICEGQSSTLNINNISGRSPINLNYTDGLNSYNETISANDYSITLTPDETITYQILYLTDQQDCEQNYSENLPLIVDIIPSPNAGFFDNAICGSSTTMQAQLSNDQNFGTWSIIEDNNGSGLIIGDINNPQTNITLNQTAQYTNEEYTLRLLEVNYENTECSDYDDVVVNFDKKPVNISLGNDTIVYVSTTVEFSTSGLNDMPLQWDLPDDVEIDDSNQDLVEARNLVMGDNEIICIVNNGICPEESVAKNIRIENIYQTTGFSPDGDGINDTFIIGGAKDVQNNTLQIFDINGKLVFSTIDFCINNDTKNGWDGIAIGDNAPKDGTYYYIFEGTVDDQAIEPIKNYLIIKGSK